MILSRQHLFFWNWNWKWRLPACFLIYAVFVFYIVPYLKLTQLEPLTKKLEARYGMTITYCNSAKSSKTENSDMRLEAVDKKMIPKVLEGVTDALNRYPPQLVKKYLSTIFIAGKIIINGVSGAATYGNSRIYISAKRTFGRQTQHEYALSIYHEFSSLLFYGTPFPLIDWYMVNPVEFKYLERYEDIINAADLKNREDPKLAHQWYEQGFVSDYGMSDMENDFNTYSELALGEPDKLRNLMKTYPRIAKKTKILVKFYAKQAPEMCDYFKSVGLASDCGLEQSAGG